MILSPKSTLGFIKALTGSNLEDLGQVSDVDRSAIQEVGNILLGASITAINKFLNLSLIHSIPDISIDKLGAILDSILIEMGAVSGEVLAFKVQISIEVEGIGGDLYYLFDPV